MGLRLRIFIRVAFVSLCVLALGACASTGGQKTYTKTERARMFLDIANAALYENDTIGALWNLKEAEALAPNLPEIHHSKALAYFGKRDLETATREARKAVELAPDYSDANNTLGKLLIDTGHYEEAIAPLKKAAVDPLYRDAYKAYTNLGILYYRRGDYALASKYIDSAIQASPNSACVAYYYQGHIHLRESRLNEAITSYDKATRKYCTAFADAQLALGIAYEKNKQYDAAKRKFLEIQQRYPNTDIAEQAVNHLRLFP